MKLLRRLRRATRTDATLHAHGAVRRALSRDPRCLFISAMPKSGSSFLSYALAELTGYSHAYCAYAYDRTEQEIYLPKVIDAYGRGTVVQQHVRANGPNLEILRDFGIRPVVLVRNLFDVVVSVRDHLVKESLTNFPSTYVSEQFLEFGEEHQLDFVVAFVVPWYLGFYVSWWDAERHGALPFDWAVYDEIVDDWPGAVRQILGSRGFERSHGEVAAAIEKLRGEGHRRVRINQAVKNRGQAALTPRQRDTILSLTRFYPGVDFGRIGLR